MFQQLPFSPTRCHFLQFVVVPSLVGAGGLGPLLVLVGLTVVVGSSGGGRVVVGSLGGGRVLGSLDEGGGRVDVLEVFVVEGSKVVVRVGTLVSSTGATLV